MYLSNMHHELNAAIAVISGCVVVWALVSARLERWDVTAPIAFVLLGLVTANGPLSLVQLHLHSADILVLAEITLALVLFSDASRVNAKTLRAHAEHSGPVTGYWPAPHHRRRRSYRRRGLS